MVTLKIAGLVVVFVLGILFAPTYFDFSAPGAALRRAIYALAQNPAFPVGLVIGTLTLIPISMLVAHLIILGSAAGTILAYLVEFFAMTLVGAVLTPPPTYLGLSKAKDKKRKKGFLDLVEQ